MIIYLRGFKSEFPCVECDGTRLKKSALGKTIVAKNRKIKLKNIYNLRIKELYDVFEEMLKIYKDSKAHNQMKQILEL